MRVFATIVAALVIAASSLADGWLLKAPYTAKSKVTWKVAVHANVGGQEHDAAFKQVLSIESKSEKEFKGRFAWTDVEMDGSGGQEELPTWATSLNPNGSISSADDGADYARMLTPLAFAYPDKEVKAGDKWTAKFKPSPDAKEMTYDCEVLEQAKVGDTDALKIKVNLTEDGPMKGTNFYWLAKDGAVLKFELDLKNWTVPFAGNPTEIDATIKGEIVK